MPKVKGKGKNLAASFDGAEKRIHPDLSICNAIVLISIKNKKECTDKYFLATAKQAINTFARTTFLMVDQAYWHNLKNGSKKSPEDLMADATLLGNEWFKSNEDSFLSLLNLEKENIKEYETLNTDQKIDFINNLAKIHKKNFTIIRWSEWLKLNDDNSDKNIKKIYAEDNNLNQAINDTAEDYTSRHGNTVSQVKTSQDYLLEECYPVMKIGAQLDNHFILYPGEISPAMRATRQFFVEKNYPNKMLWLRISFRKIGLDLNQKPVISADQLFNTNKETDAVIAQNQHLFFALDNFKKRIGNFPEYKQQKLFSLAQGFLFLLGKDNKSNKNGENSANLLETFSTYSDILLSVTNETQPSINSTYLKSLADEKSESAKSLGLNA